MAISSLIIINSMTCPSLFSITSYAISMEIYSIHIIAGFLKVIVVISTGSFCSLILRDWRTES
ncbi:hypothetical protein V1509DRAFT_630437 [Lipomyces kononenkoae]